MKVNEHIKLVGRNVVLVPYKRYHVEKYHEWMQSTELLEKTASESLSLEEEYTMQHKWWLDDDKCTFIILNKNESLLSESRDMEIITMVGDVNLFFNNEDDKNEAELEVMIAEPADRRKGYGKEAVKLMLQYGCNALGVRKYIVKIGDENKESIALFIQLGFQEQSHSLVFKETTFSLSCVTETFKKLILGTEVSVLQHG